MSDVKIHYDIFSEDEKIQIEDTIVWFMNKYTKALIEMQGLIPESLYDKLEARWKTAMKQDKELIEFVLMHLRMETSREDIQEIISKTRALFLTKKRLTRLVMGESQLVHAETEEILKKFLGLIPKEVEEEIERLNGEDFPDKLNIDDIIPYEIVFANTSTKKDPIIIPDEETVLSEDISTDSDTDIGEENILPRTDTCEENTKVEKKDEENTDEEMTDPLVNDNVQNTKQLEIGIDSLPNPIDKIEQLVTTTRDEMKSLEEAAFKNVENEYEKRRIEQLKR